MKRLSKLTVVLAIIGAVGLLGPSTAYAQVASAGAIVGQGTINPGVPGPTGGTANNAVSFTGTAVGVFADAGDPDIADVGSCNISFSGGGTDTSAFGSGGGNATCNGTGVVTGRPVSLNCALSYSRTGVVVVVTGTCSGGSVPANLRGVFIFVPLNADPTTAYRLVGTASNLSLI